MPTDLRFPKQEQQPLAIGNRGVLSSFSPCPSLGYVTATHQRGIDHGPTVLSYYYALCGADPRRERERLLSAGRDEWAEVALTDLSRAHPDLRKLTDRVDIMRWGHAVIRPTPGFVWSQARRQASEPYRTIHFANTDLSGVALCEEALHHTESAPPRKWSRCWRSTFQPGDDLECGGRSGDG